MKEMCPSYYLPFWAFVNPMLVNKNIIHFLKDKHAMWAPLGTSRTLKFIRIEDTRSWENKQKEKRRVLGSMNRDIIAYSCIFVTLIVS